MNNTEKVAATTRVKSGGRVAGTPNKPKAAARSGAVPPSNLPLAPAREADASQFPAYRLAKTDTLIPYANNARTHSAAQVTKIAASIREFGFTNPVLTDSKRGVIAGHGRILAARQLGMDVVPVIELSHLSAAQRRAYVLADNRLALDAGWDDDLLALELGELRDGGFDLSMTGFETIELGTLFGDAPETESFDATTEERVRCPTCGKFRPVAKLAGK